MDIDTLLPLDPDVDLVDLRSLDCISSYDAHLMCPICHCPFIRPVRLQCDHVFCKECLDSAITSSGSTRDDFKCPTCRTPTTDAFMNVPRLLINMCDDIRVKCPYSREGCTEIVPRGHVQAHVAKYCDYRLVDCPDESCEMKTRKMYLHPEGKCLHGLIRCSRCDEDIMKQDFEVATFLALGATANPPRNMRKTSVQASKLPVPTARLQSSEKPWANTSTPAPRPSIPVQLLNMAVPSESNAPTSSPTNNNVL